MTKILQPSPIDEREIDQVIIDSMQELVEIAEANYALSYSNWEPENKPLFYTTQKVEGNKFQVEYSTESTPFIWVDQGTKAHTQKAKNFPVMTFPERNIPRTRPGQLASFASFSSGWVSAKEVKNPGIKERDFTGVVVDILDEQGEIVFDKHFKGAKSF